MFKNVIYIFSTLILFTLATAVKAQTLTEEQFTMVTSFTFEYWDGEKTTLADHEGKIILIDFWETWCVPCIAAFPAYQQLVEEHPDQFMVLAATPEMMDDKARVDRFLSQNSYDFHFVQAGQLARDLRLTGIPFKVVIGPDGSLLFTDRGSGGAQREYQKFKKVIEEHFGL